MRLYTPLFLIALLTTGCSTTQNITVSYVFPKPIARIGKVHRNAEPAGLLGKPALITPTMVGNPTHPSHMVGKLDQELKSGPNNFVFAFASPGASGMETMELITATTTGSTLKVEYILTTPSGDLTEDFVQFRNWLNIQFE